MTERKLKILICEPTGLGRGRLGALVRAQVGDEASITGVARADELREHVTGAPWDVVFFDPGTDAEAVLEVFRSAPSNRGTFLVAVSGRTSEAELQRLAAGGVAYLIARPYPPEKVAACLDAFAASRSSYFVLLARARGVIDAGELREARELLSSALSLRETPLEAWFYLARIAVREGRFPEAAERLGLCLAADPLNYEILCEAFAVAFQLKDHHRAFELGKELVRSYHGPPEAVARTLRLAVLLQAFDDVPLLEAWASRAENGELLNHLGSALYVTGKHYLLTGRTDEALGCFDRLAPIGERFPKFLRAVCFVLARFNLREAGLEYLRRSDPGREELQAVCGFVLGPGPYDEAYRSRGRALLERYGGEDLREFLAGLG
jgi:tetratricopeptide (TPR) repeat protein